MHAACVTLCRSYPEDKWGVKYILENWTRQYNLQALPIFGLGISAGASFVLKLPKITRLNGIISGAAAAVPCIMGCPAAGTVLRLSAVPWGPKCSEKAWKASMVCPRGRAAAGRTAASCSPAAQRRARPSVCCPQASLASDLPAPCLPCRGAGNHI
jgi:hypothetical protein